METNKEKPVFTSCNDCMHQKYKQEYDEWGCTHEDCRHYPFIRLEHFKPKPNKIIDMSKFGDSDIDMEFGDSENVNDLGFTTIDKLEEDNTKIGGLYITDRRLKGFEQCRIRQDHWHSWSGGECPLPEGLLIEVKTRQDSNVSILTSYTSNHHGWRWTNPYSDNSEDIIAFKVKGAAHGWKYGWEK